MPCKREEESLFSRLGGVSIAGSFPSRKFSSNEVTEELAIGSNFQSKQKILV